MRLIPKTLKWPLFLLLTITSSTAAFAGGMLAVEDAHIYQHFSFEPYFACSVPASWGKEEGNPPPGLSQDEKKVYGIILHGPVSGVVPIRISIYFYARGNLLEDSAESYIRSHAHPFFVLKEGDSYGPVEDADVAGRKARVFERQKNEFVPCSPLEDIDMLSEDSRVYERREMMARPVPVREKFVVIPAESGFYALCYSAPADQFEEFLPDFEQVTTTFHVLQ